MNTKIHIGTEMQTPLVLGVCRDSHLNAGGSPLFGFTICGESSTRIQWFTLAELGLSDSLNGSE